MVVSKALTKNPIVNCSSNRWKISFVPNSVRENGKYMKMQVKVLYVDYRFKSMSSLAGPGGGGEEKGAEKYFPCESKY